MKNTADQPRENQRKKTLNGASVEVFEFGCDMKINSNKGGNQYSYHEHEVRFG